MLIFLRGFKEFFFFLLFMAQAAVFGGSNIGLFVSVMESEMFKIQMLDFWSLPFRRKALISSW